MENGMISLGVVKQQFVELMNHLTPKQKDSLLSFAVQKYLGGKPGDDESGTYFEGIINKSHSIRFQNASIEVYQSFIHFRLLYFLHEIPKAFYSLFVDFEIEKFNQHNS